MDNQPKDPMQPAMDQLEQALRKACFLPTEPPESTAPMSPEPTASAASDHGPSKPATEANSESSKTLGDTMRGNLPNTTALQEKQARLIALLKSGTRPELLTELTDLLTGPEKPQLKVDQQMEN